MLVQQKSFLHSRVKENLFTQRPNILISKKKEDLTLRSSMALGSAGLTISLKWFVSPVTMVTNAIRLSSTCNTQKM